MEIVKTRLVFLSLLSMACYGVSGLVEDGDSRLEWRESRFGGDTYLVNSTFIPSYLKTSSLVNTVYGQLNRTGLLLGGALLLGTGGLLFLNQLAPMPSLPSLSDVMLFMNRDEIESAIPPYGRPQSGIFEKENQLEQLGQVGQLEQLDWFEKQLEQVEKMKPSVEDPLGAEKYTSTPPPQTTTTVAPLILTLPPLVLPVPPVVSTDYDDTYLDSGYIHPVNTLESLHHQSKENEYRKSGGLLSALVSVQPSQESPQYSDEVFEHLSHTASGLPHHRDQAHIPLPPQSLAQDRVDLGTLPLIGTKERTSLDKMLEEKIREVIYRNKISARITTEEPLQSIKRPSPPDPYRRKKTNPRRWPRPLLWPFNVARNVYV